MEVDGVGRTPHCYLFDSFASFDWTPFSFSFSVSLSLSLSVRPSVRPSACLPGCLSVCLSVFLSRGSTLQGPGLELHSCILGVLGPVRVLDSVYSTGVFVVGV